MTILTLTPLYPAEAIVNAATVFNVNGHGAVGDGVVDDTAAIQRAIDAAGAAGGGVVWFPAGTYKITSTLTVGNASGGSVSSYQGVVLRGQGRRAVAGFGTSTTTLSWAGSTSGTVIKINGPIGGWGVQNMEINGGAGAANGLQVVSGQSGYVCDLLVFACTNGISTTTTSGGQENTNWNHWRNVSIYVHSATNSIGLLIDGNSDGLSNTCFELFDHVFISYLLAGTTPTGIYLNRCDNIRMRSLQFSNSAGKKAITFDYTGHSSWPTDCVIEQVEFGSATAVVSNVGTPPLLNGGAALTNWITNVSQGNGRIADPALQGLQFGNTTYGTATLTWAGGSVIGNALAVPHSLGVAPRFVTTQVMGFSGLNLPPVIECMSSFNDYIDIELRASTVDGQAPANTATVTVAWTARG